jgi:hypothetical protein
VLEVDPLSHFNGLPRGKRRDKDPKAGLDVQASILVPRKQAGLQVECR